MGTTLITDVDQLVDIALRLRSSSSRVIIGIIGEPGSGKSTVAGTIADRLGDSAAIVPMDGFHLSNRELGRLGMAGRKGAIDTFDAAGYLNLLRRLRHQTDAVVYAPDYRREFEEAIAGSIAIPADLPIVITEGNYLLQTDGPWAGVRPLLDEAWYVECDSGVRVDRLIRRHLLFGKTEAQARAWAEGSDAANAQLVRATMPHADRLIDVARTHEN